MRERGNRDVVVKRDTRPMTASLRLRITREEERMIAAMCALERRTVADMVRLLIEEGAKARGINEEG